MTKPMSAEELRDEIADKVWNSALLRDELLTILEQWEVAIRAHERAVVLEALREPTDAEFDAAWELLRSEKWCNLARKISIHDARLFFKATRASMTAAFERQQGGRVMATEREADMNVENLDCDHQWEPHTSMMMHVNTWRCVLCGTLGDGPREPPTPSAPEGE